MRPQHFKYVGTGMDLEVAAGMAMHLELATLQPCRHLWTACNLATLQPCRHQALLPLSNTNTKCLPNTSHINTQGARRARIRLPCHSYTCFKHEASNRANRANRASNRAGLTTTPSCCIVFQCVAAHCNRPYLLLQACCRHYLHDTCAHSCCVRYTL